MDIEGDACLHSLELIRNKHIEKYCLLYVADCTTSEGLQCTECRMLCAGLQDLCDCFNENEMYTDSDQKCMGVVLITGTELEGGSRTEQQYMSWSAVRLSYKLYPPNGYRMAMVSNGARGNFNLGNISVPSEGVLEEFFTAGIFQTPLRS